jgi:hypothetical protein
MFIAFLLLTRAIIYAMLISVQRGGNFAMTNNTAITKDGFMAIPVQRGGGFQ